ncbi:MAG: hypothetical protein QF411_09740, partial [Planctomycetota bacterium]|nr:hypothetical protein [Planctomycetota bacterium]
TAGTLCSVSAQGVTAQQALSAIAAELDRPLTLTSPEQWAHAAEPLTIELVQRPLEDVLDFIAGSAGLRVEREQDFLALSPELPATAPSDVLLQRASNAWQRAMKNFPADEQVETALMTLASIELARSDDEKAREYWGALVDNRPESDLAPRAIYNYGLSLERTGQWRTAVEWFTSLANHLAADELREAAWLELARCQSRLGDARQVHYLMDTLDAEFPVSTDEAKADRLLIRARAWNTQKLPVDALRCLDLAERTGATVLDEREFTSLRAQALELYGMPEAGALAWLGFSLDAAGADLALALEEAARLALVSGEEATAILIESMARDRGVSSSAVADIAFEARDNMGLTTQFTSTHAAEAGSAQGPAARLDAAEQSLANGRIDLARSSIAVLVPGSAAFDEDTRTRLAIVWASCLAAEDSSSGALDNAVAFLRETVRSLSDLEHRRRIYLAAAQLLENAGDTAGALNAYRGIL